VGFVFQFYNLIPSLTARENVALVTDLVDRSTKVIAGVDRLLAPYGGLGAMPRSRQISNWTLESELAQLRGFDMAVPLIFLGVATFVLNVALTRAAGCSRPEHLVRFTNMTA
jgi:hypothetical protein